MTTFDTNLDSNLLGLFVSNNNNSIILNCHFITKITTFFNVNVNYFTTIEYTHV